MIIIKSAHPKYIADLETEYYEENDENGDDIQDAWIEYFENYKKQIGRKRKLPKAVVLFDVQSSRCGGKRIQ